MCFAAPQSSVFGQLAPAQQPPNFRTRNAHDIEAVPESAPFGGESAVAKPKLNSGFLKN
jgi:hypothetical protein